MKNLSRYDENLSVPRKQDVDNKQNKIDTSGLLKGDGSGNIETAAPGTDYALPSLGIASASVGQVPSVVSVDEAGNPTAWKAIDMTDSNVFIIRVTGKTVDDMGETTLDVDQTRASIDAAIVAHKQCYVEYTGVYYALCGYVKTNEMEAEYQIISATFESIGEGPNASYIKMTTSGSEMSFVDLGSTSLGLPTGSSGYVLRYNTRGLSPGWQATPIDNSVGTTFDGIIKGHGSRLRLAEAGTDYMAPVAVTADDNGKFLRVVNGAWAAAEVADANGEGF